MNAFKRASIKRNGAWTPVINLYVKYQGAWRKVDDGYVKYQGKWMLMHNPDAVITLNYTIPYYSTAESYHYSNFNLLDWITTHPDKFGVIWSRDTFKTYPFQIDVTIAAGVIIKGPFTIPADFDKATRINLKNYGNIYGAAGKGGDALPPYQPSASADYLKTFNSANGKDGVDAIVNHSNLVLRNFGGIYPGGGGGHGGIPNIYVASDKLEFPYLVNGLLSQLPGWWGERVDDVPILKDGVLVDKYVFVKRSIVEDSALLKLFLSQLHPNQIPFFQRLDVPIIANTCTNLRYPSKLGTPKVWKYANPAGSHSSYSAGISSEGVEPTKVDGYYVNFHSNFPQAYVKKVSDIFHQYGNDFSSVAGISAVSDTSVTAFHGGNGGGGAGIDSLPGNYPDILKPIPNIGDAILANTWGIVKDNLNTIALSMSSNTPKGAQALAVLQSLQTKYNFSVSSLSLSTGKVYWSLPGRHAYVTCVVYYTGGYHPFYFWYHQIEDVPLHYVGISLAASTTVLNTNYYKKNFLLSPARQQTYTLGAAGTILSGGLGGKTTLAQTTPSNSWFDAWNGQAGDGGNPGQDGETLSIAASSYGGYSLPAITIKGGQGGAPVRTYSNRGSFTLVSNSGTITGEPVYS